jgi:hypothetical protein
MRQRSWVFCQEIQLKVEAVKPEIQVGRSHSPSLQLALTQMGSVSDPNSS